MAHYVGEQIAIAQNAKGVAKAEAEQKCFEAILRLWEHRAYLSAGTRPFENFDAIFRVLERLDPENKHPFFYDVEDDSSKNKSSRKLDEIKEWLDVAQSVDQAARVWIEYIFRQAALIAADEDTIVWLENSISSKNSDDVSLIVRLIGTEAENSEKEQTAKKEKLEARIKQLEAFNELNHVLRSILISELNSVTLKESSSDRAQFT